MCLLAPLCFAHPVKKIDAVIHAVSEHYVEEQATSDLSDSAIHGVFLNLDQHSYYLTAFEAQQLRNEVHGQFQGIGIALRLQDNQLIVDGVLPHSPAQKAGIKPGDVITHINGKPINTTSMEENILRIRGEDKSYVVLTIDEKKIKVKRSVIRNENVHFKTFDNIGYVQLNLFDNDTPKKLESLLSNPTLKAYIIDLRFNPGGLLNTALLASELFLSGEKRLTQIHTRHETHEVYIPSASQDILNNKPLYLLIGPHSASGAELFSSTLQFYNRAIVLGDRSRGKGTIQALLPLEDGSMIKLTTAYFTSPDGTTIDKHGVSPNYSVNSFDEALLLVQKQLGDL